MYGIMISLGILVGALLTEKQLKHKKLSSEVFWDGLLIVICFGVFGARTYHVIDYWDYYQLHLLEVFYVWQGGLGILGGLICATLAVSIFLKVKKQNIFIWLDLAVLYLPLGQAIGRIGNIFNNELLPFAYYEMWLNLMLFAVIQIGYIKKWFNPNGVIFAVYVGGYALVRILLENTRQEHWTINGLNVTQTLSLALIIGILIAYALHCLRSRWFQVQR